MSLTTQKIARQIPPIKCPGKIKYSVYQLFASALATVNLWIISGSLLLCMMVVITHIIPRASIMPIKGGKCVTVLKIGTNTKNPIPAKRMILPSFLFFYSSC